MISPKTAKGHQLGTSTFNDQNMILKNIKLAAKIMWALNSLVKFVCSCNKNQYVKCHGILSVLNQK